MAKTLALVISAILAATAIIAIYLPVYQTEVKQITVQEEKAQIPYIFNAECTQQLEIECAVDIAMTVKACAAAFETGGSDIIADIKCAKDLLADKKNCWPCICAEAKKRAWHIIGC